MSESIKQKFGFVVAALMVVAALGVLNIGATARSSTECEPHGDPKPNPSGSASPSPTESDDPFPPSLPPILPTDEETSASPSPSDSEGQARNCGSEITINYKGPNKQYPGRREFTGHVRSDEEACEAGRKVILKKHKSGPDQRVDTTVTNDNGRWRIPINRANGRYYARTPQEKVASDSGRVTCGADRSKSITV